VGGAALRPRKASAGRACWGWREIVGRNQKQDFGRKGTPGQKRRVAQRAAQLRHDSIYGRIGRGRKHNSTAKLRATCARNRCGAPDIGCRIPAIGINSRCKPGKDRKAVAELLGPRKSIAVISTSTAAKSQQRLQSGRAVFCKPEDSAALVTTQCGPCLR